MRETLKALLDLQTLDRELYQVREELRRLPEERSRRQWEVAALLARRQKKEADAFSLRTRVREIDDHTTQQRQRIRKLENEANSSRGDVALLVAYQHEIRTLKREVDEAEDEGLALDEQARALAAELEALKTEIAEAERTFAAFDENVQRELAAAGARLAKLEAERKERLGKQLEPEVLALYDRLLAARGGVALAELDGRICQGCFMEVPTNRYGRVARGLEIIQCPSCDRILFQRA